MKLLYFGAVGLLSDFTYAVHQPPLADIEYRFFIQCCVLTLLSYPLQKLEYLYASEHVERLRGGATEKSFHSVQEGMILGALSTVGMWLPSECIGLYFLPHPLSPLLFLSQKSIFFFWSFQIIFIIQSKLKIFQTHYNQMYAEMIEALLIE